jgi:hypothetical protein
VEERPEEMEGWDVEFLEYRSNSISGERSLGSNSEGDTDRLSEETQGTR